MKAIYAKLEQLVGTFGRDIEMARELKSPNPEDDLAVRAAIVGFSYHAPTSAWAKEHYDFLRVRLERDYHDGELAQYGANGENVKFFFALGLGYLLGLYEQERISDKEFQLAEVQLPGLIMFHLSTLTARRV